MSARKKADIERVENTTKDKAYWENSVWEAVREYYYTEYNAETVEQISKLGQNSFVAACEYARRCCVSRCDLMTVTPHKPNKGCTVFNECYDAERVEMLCSVYISIAFRIDKVPSVYGFSVLSGIDRETMQRWVSEGQGVTIASRWNTPKRSVQKIRDARAQSLQNVAISGGKGAVGAIACLNNEVWNNPTTEQPKEHALRAEELPYPVFSADGSATWVQGLPEKREKGALDALELPTFASADNVDI